MPGYGFASAPEPKVRAWTKLVLEYLRGRPNLARVYVLIDGRHGVKNTDTPRNPPSNSGPPGETAAAW